MKKILLTLLALGTISALAPVRAASLPDSLQTSVDQYLVIQTALAGDSLDGVPEAATALAEAAKASDGAVPAAVSSQAEAVGKAGDLKAAREAFKPLSATLVAALAAQNPKSGEYYEAFCPMADAAWVQADKSIANPYYGASMLKCGSIRKDL
ncbi:MAG: DUF3347 domain-containing protein [Chthoniobacterales bacterium]